jgi:hypothetical protein
MGKMKFGGVNLPEGSVTSYDHSNPDGTIAYMTRIKPGDVIDEERVVDAQSFIDRGMATRVAVTTAADEAAPADKGE